MKFQQQFILFLLVGTIGFCVDTAVLYLLKDSVGLYGGRVLSFTASVFATWVLNRNLTFSDRTSGKTKHHEFAIYFSLMMLGGLANYSAYALMIFHFKLANAQPVWAVAVGSLAGMGINLCSSRFLLYRFKNSPEQVRPLNPERTQQAKAE